MLTTLTRHKNALVSLGIFIAIFITLGLPFTNWGFLHDDWGVIYHAKTMGNDLLTLFTEGSMTKVTQPSNYLVPEQSFFAVLYRPFVYAFLHVQMLLFGVTPYALLLITIFFHALNAILLFMLLLSFITFWESFFATLLFAFHLSLWDWMGWIAGQNQVVNLTLVLGIVWLVKKYLDQNKSWYLLPTTLLYTISLFYREEALILPFWLIISIPLYLKNHRIKKIIITTSPLFIATISYFIVRLYNFPLKSTGAGIKGHLNFTSFLYSLKDRFFDLVTFLSDITNLAWLPGGNRLLKGSLIALLLSFALWLFYKNKNKLVILYCIISMFMFMWPAIWRYYSSRFLYMGLPFLVVAMVLLVTNYRYKNSESRTCWVKAAGIFCIALTLINSILLFTHFRHREHALHTVANAYKELIHNPAITGKTLCFIGLPYDTFVTGVAQAMWLNGFPANTPIYYDNATFIWGNTIKQENISIKQTKDGFRLTSNNPDHAWFLITNSCMPMGEKIVRKEQWGRIIEFSYHVKPQYLTPEHLWVTWDYKNQRFKV